MTDEVVYEANRSTFTRLPHYIAAVWRHRQLAINLARAEVKASHQDTLLGQFWQLLNPILLAVSYLFLFEIVAPRPGGFDFLALLLVGLFPFYFTRDAAVRGAGSVLGGGWLVTNTRLPRAVLPLAAVLRAIRSFSAACVVYIPIHLISGQGATWALLALPLVLALLALFNLGLALLLSAAAVFVRDVRTALPYGVRIWLYTSPVLYTFEEVPDKLEPVLIANPLTSFLTPIQQILTEGRWPSGWWMLGAVAWSLGALLVGSLFFASKEHEFAFRL
jgi:ABC-type polysaccharide/polyol phosphate export permease